MAVACACAARLADASPEVVQAMQDFGGAVGRAYQMTDDMLDQEADLQKGAATAALCMSREDMQQKAEIALQRARKILGEVGAPADALLWDFLESLARNFGAQNFGNAPELTKDEA
jgi:geranylgeranyl pyrophosphate synthase